MRRRSGSCSLNDNRYYTAVLVMAEVADDAYNDQDEKHDHDDDSLSRV